MNLIRWHMKLNIRKFIYMVRTWWKLMVRTWCWQGSTKFATIFAMITTAPIPPPIWCLWCWYIIITSLLWGISLLHHYYEVYHYYIIIMRYTIITSLLWGIPLLHHYYEVYHYYIIIMRYIIITSLLWGIPLLHHYYEVHHYYIIIMRYTIITSLLWGIITFLWHRLNQW